MAWFVAFLIRSNLSGVAKKTRRLCILSSKVLSQKKPAIGGSFVGHSAKEASKW